MKNERNGMGKRERKRRKKTELGNNKKKGNQKKNKFATLLLIAVVVVGFFVSFFSFFAYRFTSTEVVMINDETTVKNVTCTSKNDVARVEGAWQIGPRGRGRKEIGEEANSFSVGGCVCPVFCKKTKQNKMECRSFAPLSVCLC